MRIALGQFADDTVFEHLSEGAELAVTVPVVSKVEQISRAFREGFQPMFCYGLDKRIDAGNTRSGSERPVLLGR